MSNPLRRINENFSKLKLFSIEWFFLLGAIIGITTLLNHFINFNIRIVGIIFILLGIILWIENYYYQKDRAKQFVHELMEYEYD